MKNKEKYIGKEVELYIPEKKESIITTIKDVKKLSDGKEIAFLESGTVLSVDILKFVNNKEEKDNNGKE